MNKKQKSRILLTKFPYVDTHCHFDSILEESKISLDNKSYEEAKVELNFPEGFEGMLTIGCEPETFMKVRSLLDLETNDIRAAFGVHPHDAKLYTTEIESQLIEFAQLEKVVGFGEIGLDYHYLNSTKEVQQEVFIKQLKIGVSMEKPLIIHTREAEEDTYRIMKEHVPQDYPIHLHCFTSTKTFLQKMLDHFTNLYVGFTGVITFRGKKSNPIREAVKMVPLDKILSETDGPYMSPVPWRGKISHPGRIPWIIKKIAELKEVEEKQAFAQIRLNAKTLYKF
ncbi:deoxyribonuclease tatdn2-related [Anaeramoeba flamelloides]|uniref:Deoxyribonuclease tatdn2-related n=1 Tax=Anaeramoeba flamelloides TaxID=1746091 RepID=A0AAV7ZB55_9EUKA|nr:deoxyribonuclease tatdn2-related [Anaeramoeba flamelloides]KAJ6231184.1 deoxyribonuclease tatdn2-related [Anaeramoeba flamelloides]